MLPPRPAGLLLLAIPLALAACPGGNGSSPDASAYNRATGSSHIVTGNHIARASNLLNITAGKAITITADLGHAFSSWSVGRVQVEIGASGEASGTAYNYTTGTKNKVSGNQDALATTLLSMNAGTGVTVSGQGGVSISAGSAEASAYNLANGSTNVVTGVTKAGGTNNVVIKTTTGNISMTASSGDVSINASSSAEADAYNRATGDKNTVTGTNTATAANGIAITATGGAISLQAGDNVNIYGASATADAYNYASGSPKRMLEAAGWSYWDRRGHLRWWLPEVGLMLNDTTVGSFVTGADGPDPLRPVTGTGGISVALGLLVSPHDPLGVREIARMAGMSPSTISRARQHLVDAGLVESDGTPLVPELFWALSDAWVVKPVPVSARPVGDGWAVAGEAVAALNTGRRCWVTGSASTVRNAGSSIRTG